MRAPHEAVICAIRVVRLSVGTPPIPCHTNRTALPGCGADWRRLVQRKRGILRASLPGHLAFPVLQVYADGLSRARGGGAAGVQVSATCLLLVNFCHLGMCSFVLGDGCVCAEVEELLGFK